MAWTSPATLPPAVVFYRVFECDNAWSADSATSEVDTVAAGANVIIQDGSTNTVNGGHVARIYKDDADEKKLWKIDGAFYSFMSMNVDGGPEDSGVLNINADNEGLDTELHLTINGGNISIVSHDDGINTNEDGVSVTTINGGTLHILAGVGAEGDGVDSNGWLVINGGTVISMANPRSDAGLDSDMGSFVNGGTVVALGSTMDWAESDSEQVTMNLQFAAQQSAGDAIVVMDGDGKVVFAYDPSEDETAGTQVRSYQGAVLSCPDFEVGATYAVYIGGTLEGAETQGVYDAETMHRLRGWHPTGLHRHRRGRLWPRRHGARRPRRHGWPRRSRWPGHGPGCPERRAPRDARRRGAACGHARTSEWGGARRYARASRRRRPASGGLERRDVGRLLHARQGERVLRRGWGVTGGRVGRRAGPHR